MDVLRHGILIKNRKALYNHEVLETIQAGIVLRGYEVKAIREGQANLEGTFVKVIGNEAFIVNMYIGAYSKQSQEIDAIRARESKKLLMTKKEIAHLSAELSQKGRTAVPLSFVTKGPLLKVEVGIVKGKKDFEKKQVLKDRQIKSDLALQDKLRTY